MKNQGLRRSFFLLAGLAAALALASHFFSGNRVVAEYVPNLLSEILGILLTVFLIDRVLRNHQEKEHERFRLTGLRQLKSPLYRILNLLLNMYKASIYGMPNPPPREAGDLLEDEFYHSLGFLDFSKDAPVFPDMSWFNYIHHECVEFKNGIDGVIGKFGMYFSPGTVELLMEIKESSLVSYLLNARSVLIVDRKLGVQRPYNMLGGEDFENMLKRFLEDYVRLVDIYNAGVDGEHRISCASFPWAEQIAPHLGSGRLSGT